MEKGQLYCVELKERVRGEPGFDGVKLSLGAGE